MRLIDADALIEEMDDIDSWLLYDDWGNQTVTKDLIDNAPTIDAVIIKNRKSQQPKIGDAVFVRGRIDEIRRDTVIIRNDGGYFGTDYSEVVKFFVEDDVVYGVQLFRQTEETSTLDICPYYHHELTGEPFCEMEDRRHGTWKDIDGDGQYWLCSSCGEVLCCNNNFCPNCGAKMDGERSEE